jgi:hypothetical protein
MLHVLHEREDKMAELKEILMFCTLYSGVILGALAYTLNVTVPAPQKVRRD